MLPASTTLAAAIIAQSQDPVATVKVDFDRDGYSGTDDLSAYALSVQVGRALTSDVPDGTRLVSGVAAASASAGLGGNKLDNDENGAWTFSPTNTESPYYGKRRTAAPVQIRAGFITTAGAEYLPRFNGHARTLGTDGSARTAELTALDGSDAMLTEVQLPMWTNVDHPGLNGGDFIEYILQQNGITGYVLEPSLNLLVATPFVQDKQDAWTLIQQIADAEYGVAFFDENGIFRFWNREHFTRQAVDYTAKTVTVGGTVNPIPAITSARSLKTLTTNEAIDAVRNHIIVHYTTYEIQPADWIWQSTDAIRIGIKTSRTITANFDNPCINVSNTFAYLGHGFTSDGKSGYRACRRINGLGEAVTNLTFTISITAQTAKITIHNPNPFYCYLVSPQADPQGNLYDDTVVGQPMLWLKGQAVVDSASETTTTDGGSGVSAELTDDSSVTDFGEQLFEVDTGGWIQDADTALELCTDLLSLLSRPMPYLGDVDVIADPRLQLGDRIELVDDTGMALDEHCWIVGISETIDPSGGYSQTLGLRMCNAIGGWILGHPTRSKLGETTVLGGVY